MKSLVTYLTTIYCINYAILLNSSKGFFNYRHMSNIQIFYNNLIRNGFAEDHICALFVEDLLKDDRNIDKNHIYYDQKKHENYNGMKSDGYAIGDFLNCLMGYHYKLKEINGSSNILVYLCGHGTDGIFKFQDKEYMTKNDLMFRLKIISKKVNKVLLIVDTCQAETLVDEPSIPENVFVVTTSKKSESSISTFFNENIGVSCVDNFPYYLYDHFRNQITDTPLIEFFSSLLYNDIGSTIKYSQKYNFYYSDFFIQNKKSSVIKYEI